MVLSRWGTMVWKACKKHLQLAKWGLFFAQNGYRDCDGGRSPCANGLRICRNEIVPPTKWRRQLPKRYCPLRKRSSHLPKRNCPSDTEASAIAMGLCASWHVVHLNCDENLADGTNAIYHLAIRFIHLNKSKITWDEWSSLPKLFPLQCCEYTFYTLTSIT